MKVSAKARGAALLAAAVWSGCNCKGSGPPSVVSDVGELQAPSKIDFGTVPVGQRIRLSHIPLQNAGSGAVAITSQQILNDVSNSFSEPVSLQFASTLAPGNTTTASLDFIPTDAGVLTATLEINSSAANGKLDIPLSGTGIVVDVSAAPSAVDFGPVQVGATKTLSVAFTNQGNESASISVNAVSTLSEFRVANTDGSPVSSTAVQTLAASGGAYSVSITFVPDQAQNFSSSFSWTPCSGCGALPITLTGLGVDGSLQITPTPIGFGTVGAGQSQTQAVTVANIGTNAVSVSCVYLASQTNAHCGTGSAVFGLAGFAPSSPSPSSPLVLAPPFAIDAGPSSLTLNVAYTASGNASGDSDTLEVDYLPIGATAAKTATDPLSGNEVLAPCQITVAPASINFGTVSVGTTVARSTTLTNDGQSACSVSAVAIDPTSDPSYAVDPSQATSFSIPAGGSATVTADIDLDNTSAPATRRGEIDLTTTDPSQPSLQIPLTALVPSQTPYAGGWPKWHHDNHNSGKSEADTSGLAGVIAWSFKGLQSTSAAALGSVPICGVLAYVNSPVVADDPSGNGAYSVYQLSMDGTLYALDSSGNLEWKESFSSPTGDPHPSTPAVTKSGNIWLVTGSDKEAVQLGQVNLAYLDGGGSLMYQETYGNDGFDACPGLGLDGTLFEADDDGEVGSHSTTDPYTVMAFTANANGQVNLAKGLQLPINAESERFGVAIADDESSYWGNNGQFFAVTSPAAGFQPETSWPATGVVVYVDAGANPVGSVISDLAIDPNNTGFLFAYVASDDGPKPNTSIIGGITPTTGTYTVQGTIAALSLQTGAVQWTFALPPNNLPSGWSETCSDYGNAAPAVDDDGTVYVGNSDGLRSFAGATGTLNWFYPTANVSSSPAIGGDGSVFFGCSDGNFYALRKDGTLRFKFQFPGIASASPAIADDGTVFVVSDDGTLWAIR